MHIGMQFQLLHYAGRVAIMVKVVQFGLAMIPRGLELVAYGLTSGTDKENAIYPWAMMETFIDEHLP